MRKLRKMFWAALASDSFAAIIAILGICSAASSLMNFAAVLASPDELDHDGAVKALFLLLISIILIPLGIVSSAIARRQYCWACSLDELTSYMQECFKMAQREPWREELWFIRRRNAWKVYLRRSGQY